MAAFSGVLSSLGDNGSATGLQLLVYSAELRAIGTGDFTARRQALTGALNTAYDELLTARSTATGRFP